MWKHRQLMNLEMGNGNIISTLWWLAWKPEYVHLMLLPTQWMNEMCLSSCFVSICPETDARRLKTSTVKYHICRGVHPILQVFPIARSRIKHRQIAQTPCHPNYPSSSSRSLSWSKSHHCLISASIWHASTSSSKIRRSSVGVFLIIVRDGRFDGILGKHRAVDL